jgi:monoterpene epsilon-lactone hydrolase
LRAELVRVGVRWVLKRRSRHETVAKARQRLAAAEALIPTPPAGAARSAVDASGVTGERITMPGRDAKRHILYLHGGAYTIGSPSSYRHLTWRLAAAARANVFVIDYRLAPEHPFPAAIEDAAAAYRWLLADGAEPRHVAIVGDSAGGGLAFATLLKMRDEGIALPAAIVAFSPWTDLALTGASLAANAKADPMLDARTVLGFAQSYLAGADPRTPYASPLYGDLAGLPPTLIQVGSDEILRDDSVRMADNMRAAGCQVELEIWRRMPHVWHLFAPILPEAHRAIARMGTFLDRHL